jgi:hypothetical protein
MTPEEIKNALAAVESSPIASEWAKGFSVSIIEQINKGRKLSEKQMFHVNKIIADNSENAQIEAEKWMTTYHEKYQADAEYLAGYYATTNYFRSIVDAITAGRTPPRRAFLKMYGNKYAKKILAEREKPPRFDARTHVVGNSKFRTDKVVRGQPLKAGYFLDQSWHILNESKALFSKHGGFIVRVENRVVSAAKGNKIYSILPVSGKSIIHIEERFLKKAKR